MKKLGRLLKTTIMGGLLFLIPFAVLLIVLGKVQQVVGGVIGPIAERIPVQSVIGLETPKVLTAVVLVFVCFLAGLFAQTRVAQAVVGWLESSLLSNIPGYSLVKSLGEEVAGANASRSTDPVLVRFDDAWQIGFLVERIPEGRVAVFIPDAPSPWSGSVLIMDEDRVKPLEVPSTSTLKSLKRLGKGTAALVEGKFS